MSAAKAPPGLIEQLAAFVAVAESGGFRSAAERLGRSQPAVTAQIKRLEDHLGSLLFHRTTRRVALTPAGNELLQRAKRLLGEADTLLQDFAESSGGARGRVRLSVSPTVGASLLSAAAMAFTAARPETALSVREDLAPGMFEALSSGEAELGLGPYADTPDRLRFEALWRQPFYLLCARSHPLAAAGSVALARLADVALICPSAGTTARAALDAEAARVGITLRPRHEASQFLTLADMAAAGAGVTVMPLANRRLIEALDLVALPFRDAEISRPIGLISRRGEVLSPPAAAFAAFLKNEARSGSLHEAHGLERLT